MTYHLHRILWLIWLGSAIFFVSLRLLPWWVLLPPLVWILRFEWLANRSGANPASASVSQDRSRRIGMASQPPGQAHLSGENIDGPSRQIWNPPPEPGIQVIWDNYAFRATSRGLEWADVQLLRDAKVWNPVREGSPPHIDHTAIREIRGQLSRINQTR